MSLTIWCNTKFNDADTRLLLDGVRPHQLVFAGSGCRNDDGKGVLVASVVEGRPVNATGIHHVDPTDLLSIWRAQYVSLCR